MTVKILNGIFAGQIGIVEVDGFKGDGYWVVLEGQQPLWFDDDEIEIVLPSR